MPRDRRCHYGLDCGHTWAWSRGEECPECRLQDAYDAQATRLAAVEQAVADNQWMHASHAVERANDLRPRGYCAVCHDQHPCDAISLLEDVEAGLRGEYPPAWMRPQETADGR